VQFFGGVGKAETRMRMNANPFHTAYLQPEEVLAIHQALLSAGHEEIAGLLANKARRTYVEKRYAAAVQLGDEDSFSLDEAPVVSASESGAYVMVWRWVDQNEISD
jgi:DNA-binding LacI/PurR family transcriptional regulator